MKERATEQEWLEWFYMNADFGPADSSIRHLMKKEFMMETGKNLPEGYNHGEDGESLMDN